MTHAESRTSRTTRLWLVELLPPTRPCGIVMFAKLGHADHAIREIEATTIEHILALANTPLSTIMVPWRNVQKYAGDLSVNGLGREQFVIVEGAGGEPEGIATLSDGLDFLWCEEMRHGAAR